MDIHADKVAQAIPELRTLLSTRKDLQPQLIAALEHLLLANKDNPQYVDLFRLWVDTLNATSPLSLERVRAILACAPLLPPHTVVADVDIERKSLSLEEHIRWFLLSGQRSILGHIISVLEVTYEDTSNPGPAVSVPFSLLPALLDRVAEQEPKGRSVESSDISARITSALSEIVCDRLDQCSAAEAVRMVQILTGRKVPMDEFWLFMLAKRIQNVIDELGPKEVTCIADCFAKRYLEDDAFFESLTQRVIALGGGQGRIDSNTLATFVLSCGVVRYRDEKLLSDIARTYRGQWGRWSTDARAKIIGGFTQLDALNVPHILDVFRTLDYPTCRSMSREFCSQNLLIAAMYFPRALAALPHMVRHIGTSRDEMRSSYGRFLRRYIFLSLLANSGALYQRAESLPLACLRALRKVKNVIEDERNYTKGGSYEPETSSFQIEVSSILHIIDVNHNMEVRRKPFILDMVLPPGN